MPTPRWHVKLPSHFMSSKAHLWGSNLRGGYSWVIFIRILSVALSLGTSASHTFCFSLCVSLIFSTLHLFLAAEWLQICLFLPLPQTEILLHILIMLNRSQTCRSAWGTILPRFTVAWHRPAPPRRQGCPPQRHSNGPVR